MTDRDKQLEQMDLSSTVMLAVIIAIFGVLACIANMAIIGLFFNSKFSFADNNDFTITMFVLFMLGGIAFMFDEIAFFFYNYRAKMLSFGNCCKACIGGAAIYVILILILPNMICSMPWWDGVAFLLIQIFSCISATLCIVAGVLLLILGRILKK